MAVANGHAYAGVGVHHLLGRNHLELVGIGVEPKALGGGGDGGVVALDELEGPVAWVGQGLHGALATGSNG